MRSAALLLCCFALAAPAAAMDFKGQYHNERFFQIFVVIFGAVGFVAGYIKSNFQITFLFLASLITQQAAFRILVVLFQDPTNRRSTRPASTVL